MSTQSKKEDDPLLDELRRLPVHAGGSAPREARAAFLRAHDGGTPWYAGVTRAVVPVGLASIVSLYLLWAFATAIAINR